MEKNRCYGLTKKIIPELVENGHFIGGDYHQTKKGKWPKNHCCCCCCYSNRIGMLILWRIFQMKKKSILQLYCSGLKVIYILITCTTVLGGGCHDIYYRLKMKNNKKKIQTCKIEILEKKKWTIEFVYILKLALIYTVAQSWCCCDEY